MRNEIKFSQNWNNYKGQNIDWSKRQLSKLLFRKIRNSADMSKNQPQNTEASA